MKKLALLVTIVLLSGVFANARSRWATPTRTTKTAIQISPVIGYGFGVGGEQITIDGSTNVYHSGGAGFNIGVGILFPIEKNFDVQITPVYVFGANEKANIISAFYLPIDLTAKISTKVKEFNIYTGFGPTFAFRTMAEIEGVEPTGYKATRKRTYNSGIGWNAVLGISSDKDISLFFSISLRSVNLKPKRSEIIISEDRDPLTIREMVTEYEEHSIYDDPDNLNTPTIKNTWLQSFSSISINAGVRF